MKVSNALNKNTGFIIVVSIVIFGLLTLNLLHRIINTQQNTKRSVENTEVIIMKLEQSTEDIKADNKRNTEYLNCLLVAHDVGQFEISTCKNEADIQAAQDHAEHQPSSNPATQPAPQPSSPSQPQQPEAPPSPPNEGLIPDGVPILGPLL